MEHIHGAKPPHDATGRIGAVDAEPPKPQRAQPPVTHITDAVIVVGRVVKPEVIITLGRTDFHYKGILSTPDSFTGKIRTSVRKNPF